LSVADVDRDGDLDFFVASGESDTISWYENNNQPFHFIVRDTGTLTLDTCKEAVYLHPTLKDVGAIYRFTDFRGRLTFLNVGGESNGNPLMSFAGNCSGAHRCRSTPAVRSGR
jgi:hypothetical protein